MCMAGLSLDDWKPLILRLSTLIGKRVFVLTLRLVTNMLYCFLGQASLIAINCKQLAQNYYFPSLQFMFPGELGFSKLC